MRRSRRISTVDFVPVRASLTELQQRLGRTPPWALDAVLGTLILVAGLLTTGGGDTDSDVVYRERDGVALVLILAGTLPYYVRRRAPLAVYLVTMTAVVVLMLRGYGEGALSLVLLLGAYTVGALVPAAAGGGGRHRDGGAAHHPARSAMRRALVPVSWSRAQRRSGSPC